MAFKTFKRFPFLTVIVAAALIAAVVIYLERVAPGPIGPPS
jgi:hypothetical protein